MYNLFVSGDPDAWDGKPWLIELDRCVREYTEEAITSCFGRLDSQAIAELKRLPCIFAYEKPNNKPPHFGSICEITKRDGQVRVVYEIEEVRPFLSAEKLASLVFELDLRKQDLHRTHWAVKSVDLARELRAHGIELPDWACSAARAVDITKHHFDIALSFPGKSRPLVEQIASELERRLGPNTYFYDNNYIPQLARPSLDVLLQDIYRHRSKLVVVFLGADYQNKDWCGVEFRAISEIIFERDKQDRVMLIRVDDGDVKGVFKTDGCIDANRFAPSQLAEFICERARLTT